MSGAGVFGEGRFGRTGLVAALMMLAADVRFRQLMLDPQTFRRRTRRSALWGAAGVGIALALGRGIRVTLSPAEPGGDPVVVRPHR